MGFVKKKKKKSFISPYTWVSITYEYKIWAEESFECEKVLSLSQDLRNLRKDLTISYELIFSLYIEICLNFVTFNMCYTGVFLSLH